MSQPAYAIEYLGAISIEAGVSYSTTDILTAYPTATVIQMKTEGIKVGIDGGVMFLVAYDDESYLASGKSFIFDNPCIVAIGIYKAIV